MPISDEYEGFSARALKVMALANQKSQSFNHEYIGDEHILFGLMAEDRLTNSNMFASCGIDIGRATIFLSKLVKSGPDMITMGKLPKTPRAKKAIEKARVAATELKSAAVLPGHLFIGILREEPAIAVRSLIDIGAKPGELCGRVLSFLSPKTELSLGTVDPTAATDFLQNFSKRTRRALVLANEEATRLNHEYIGTEHFMLGLIRLQQGPLVELFKGLNVTLERARRETIAIAGQGVDMVTKGTLPKTPNAIRALVIAKDLGDKRDERVVRSQDLLSGLFLGYNEAVASASNGGEPLSETHHVGVRVLSNITELQPDALYTRITQLLATIIEPSATAETAGTPRAETLANGLPLEQQLAQLMGQFSRINPTRALQLYTAEAARLAAGTRAIDLGIPTPPAGDSIETNTGD